MEKQMEETSDDELEEHMVLVMDAEVDMIQAAVGRMAVGIPVEMEMHRVSVGIAAAEQEHRMTAGIVGVELCHMAVDTAAVVVARRTPTNHLVLFCILVLAEEIRTPKDHPSAVLPPLANLGGCNPVVARSSAVEDTNLVSGETTCQRDVETPRKLCSHRPNHVV